jgi:membrane protease YdiL (CAAX protease family)
MMLTSDLPTALRFAATYLVQHLILVIPLAVLYTRLYHGTGGSLLLSMLLHASYNMTVTIVATAWPGFPLSWLVGL